MANIFPRQKLKELASKVPTSEIIDKVEIVKRWLNDYETGTLKTDKETSREQAYNQDIFIKVLGYDEKPSSPYSFEPKPSTSKGELPDAIVGHLTQSAFTFADQKVSAVVELKGASVGLDKPQKREGNMSPVQQGFKYKPKYKYCPFVVVSNFYEFRLYQDNQLDYEVWTLKDLCNEQDEFINFKTFYFLLNKSNFVAVNGEGQSATEELLTDIRTEQEEIGKDFYQVYKKVRIELLRSMWRHNDQVKTDIDFGIEKAQKIIDRVVFACFAEDRGLLPDDTLRRLIKNCDEGFGSLWGSLKGFFEAIDIGNERLEIPIGYNGGLFAEDIELNSLLIDDQPLRALAELSDYDFVEQLSVQILGHIFEQSITDLEEIKEKAEDYINTKLEVNEKRDQSKVSKRKKEGIFYTPDYIVKYIVDNSLGEYLRNAEESFKSEAGLKGDINDKNYSMREKKAYGRYQDFLKDVKVCDPACGSGAFLVQVFDYLLQENKRVAEILDSLYNQDDFISDILHNNIYGVDLNEESVEISKLSLWLKSAKKGKQLTSLSNNIKCGNSLIQDSLIPDVNAFDWRSEFPEVFTNGGFDVVVGNPPYVKEFTSKEPFVGLHDHPIYQGKMDLWYFFGALAIDIIKQETGRIGFIAPSNWVTNSGASKFRNKVVEEGRIVSFVDFADFKVFDQAGIQTMVYIMAKSKYNDKYEFLYRRLKESKVTSDEVQSMLNNLNHLDMDSFQAKMIKEENLSKPINISNNEIGSVINKISSTAHTQFMPNEIATGIDVHQDFVNKKSAEVLGNDQLIGAGIFNLTKLELDALQLSKDELSLIKPFYTSAELGRYTANPNNKLYVIYTDSKFKNPETIEKFPRVKAHLDRFKSIITSDNKPYGLHRARAESFFQGEKIISLRKCERPTFTFTDFDCYVSQTYFSIKTARFDLKFLTAVLNSQLIEFWLRYKGKMQGDLYQVDKEPLLTIPLKQCGDVKPFVEKVDLMIELSNDLSTISNKFSTIVMSEFELKRWSPGLSEWWLKDFEEFLKAIKSKFTLSQKDELFDLFSNYQKQLSQLNQKISSTNDEIDDMVYLLYSLNQEEITLIKKSLQ